MTEIKRNNDRALSLGEGEINRRNKDRNKAALSLEKGEIHRRNKDRNKKYK